MKNMKRAGWAVWIAVVLFIGIGAGVAGDAAVKLKFSYLSEKLNKTQEITAVEVGCMEKRFKVANPVKLGGSFEATQIKAEPLADAVYVKAQVQLQKDAKLDKVDNSLVTQALGRLQGLATKYISGGIDRKNIVVELYAGEKLIGRRAPGKDDELYFDQQDMQNVNAGKTEVPAAGGAAARNNVIGKLKFAYLSAELNKNQALTEVEVGCIEKQFKSADPLPLGVKGAFEALKVQADPCEKAVYLRAQVQLTKETDPDKVRRRDIMWTLRELQTMSQKFMPEGVEGKYIIVEMYLNKKLLARRTPGADDEIFYKSPQDTTRDHTHDGPGGGGVRGGRGGGGGGGGGGGR